MKVQLNIPDTDREIISEIVTLIKKSKTAYITFHARPDGDALGGGLALFELLESNGVKTDIISPTPINNGFSFFNNFDKVKTEIPENEKDLGFILDCSDTTRLEGISGILGKAKRLINIDHHKLNQEYGDLNYIRPEGSSISELILNLALAMNFEMDYDFALCIYVGILTDTNRFLEQNTTPRSHEISAELIKHFISPFKISSLIYGNQDMGTMKLTAMAIQSLKISERGTVGYITITPEIFKQTGTGEEHLEGIINFARNIKGVEVGVLFRKIDGLNGVKVSFRSKGKIDVGDVAGCFGGGGHHNAAGCLIKGEFEEVEKIVINTIETKLKSF